MDVQVRVHEDFDLGGGFALTQGIHDVSREVLFNYLPEILNGNLFFPLEINQFDALNQQLNEQIYLLYKSDSDIKNSIPSVPLTTKGDLLGFSTSNVRVPVGADGTFLKADSAAARGVSWASIPTGITVNSTPITGGTNNNVLFQASGNVSQSSNLQFDSSSRLLIGNPTAAAQIHAKATADGNKIGIFQQNSNSQTGAFWEAQKADGTPMAKLQKDGWLTVGGSVDGDSDYIALYVRTASSYPFRVHHTTNGQLMNLSNAGALSIAGSFYMNGEIYGCTLYGSTYFADAANSKGYFNTGISGVNWQLINRVAGNIPLVVEAHASQTANLFEVRGLSSKTFAIDKDANLLIADGSNIVFGTTTGSSLGSAFNQKTGMHGEAIVQDTGWSVSGYTALRSYDASTGSHADLGKAFCTLVEYLVNKGILGT